MIDSNQLKMYWRSSKSVCCPWFILFFVSNQKSNQANNMKSVINSQVIEITNLCVHSFSSISSILDWCSRNQIDPFYWSIIYHNKLVIDNKYLPLNHMLCSEVNCSVSNHDATHWLNECIWDHVKFGKENNICGHCWAVVSLRVCIDPFP